MASVRLGSLIIILHGMTQGASIRWTISSNLSVQIFLDLLIRFPLKLLKGREQLGLHSGPSFRFNVIHFHHPSSPLFPASIPASKLVH
ncbi:hypothetical protein QBC44DRAFT_81292 [Cladorrhinum sp. PSN332]|nr:hypothetical protein QBC44DRAFT_81292 [Cladorrhinum sp. PSN332]